MTTFTTNDEGRDGDIITWVAEANGSYKITAAGAGYNFVDDQRGALIEGEFYLESEDVLYIALGQVPTHSSNPEFSGSGGTFVARRDIDGDHNFLPEGYSITLLVAAGGAGGYSSGSAPLPDLRGQSGESGGDSSGGQAGGTDGQGGTQGSSCFAQAGAGFLGDGNGCDDDNAQRFLAGARGAAGDNARGGFGGGGTGRNDERIGGGGGYSGGAALGGSAGHGGGGGSYNAGANKNNLDGINAGNGYVIISLLVTGRIRGAVLGSSGGIEREVYVYSRDDGRLFGSTTSDAETGEFEIDVPNTPSGEYFVVAFNKEDNKNALIYDRVVAEDL